MIQVITDRELGAGLKNKSVLVYLRSEDESGVVEYRSAEIIAPADADSQAYVSKNVDIDGLWKQAVLITEGVFMAVYQKRYRQYYYRILQAVQKALSAGGSVDTITAAALEAIATVSVKRAEFDQWRALLGIDAAAVTDAAGKRDLLMAILAFANSGIIAGQL